MSRKGLETQQLINSFSRGLQRGDWDNTSSTFILNAANQIPGSSEQLRAAYPGAVWRACQRGGCSSCWRVLFGAPGLARSLSFESCRPRHSLWSTRSQDPSQLKKPKLYIDDPVCSAVSHNWFSLQFCNMYRL